MVSLGTIHCSAHPSNQPWQPKKLAGTQSVVCLNCVQYLSFHKLLNLLVCLVLGVIICIHHQLHQQCSEVLQCMLAAVRSTYCSQCGLIGSYCTALYTQSDSGVCGDSDVCLRNA